MKQTQGMTSHHTCELLRNWYSKPWMIGENSAFESGYAEGKAQPCQQVSERFSTTSAAACRHAQGQSVSAILAASAGLVFCHLRNTLFV
jgi:hypothetical protein